MTISATNTNNGIKDFQCAQCDYSASANTTLKDHVKAVHNNIKDFIGIKTITSLWNLNIKNKSAYEKGLLRNYAFVFTMVEIFWSIRVYRIHAFKQVGTSKG